MMMKTDLLPVKSSLRAKEKHDKQNIFLVVEITTKYKIKFSLYFFDSLFLKCLSTSVPISTVLIIANFNHFNIILSQDS